MKNLTILGVTPFEKPDVNLMTKLLQAGAFPVLSLGHDIAIAQEALNQLDRISIPSYGIHLTNDTLTSLQLSEQVSFAIVPFGISINAYPTL
jgi:hypothetical protein